MGRNLADPVAGFKRLHYHLFFDGGDILFEAQFPRDIRSDGAEPVLAVGEADIEPVIYAEGDYVTPHHPYEFTDIAVEFVGAAPHPRAGDMVGVSRDNRLHQPRDIVGRVRAVGVDEDEDIAGRRAYPHPHGRALALFIINDDARPACFGYLFCPVGRVAVDDNYLVGVLLAALNYLAYRRFFVLGAYYDGDVRIHTFYIAYRLIEKQGKK